MFLHDVDEIFLAKVIILDLKVLNAYNDILSLFDSNEKMKSYNFLCIVCYENLLEAFQTFSVNPV